MRQDAAHRDQPTVGEFEQLALVLVGIAFDGGSGQLADAGQDYRFRHSLRAVPGDDVPDFTSQRGGQFGVALRELQKARLDTRLPTRQSEGVNLGRVENHELSLGIRQLIANRLGDPPTHPCDPFLESEIGRHLLLLLDGRERFLPER